MQQFNNVIHINDVDLRFDEYNKFKNINISKKRIDNEWTGFKNAECVIISMENKDINFNILNGFKNIKDCYCLLLLRSPYTNFSSVWKVYEKEDDKKKILNDIVRKWVDYSKIFTQNNHMIKVLYDEFSSNKDYRSKIFKCIGIRKLKIDEKVNIKYQESSYENNSKSKQVYKSIRNCSYKDDQEFLKIVKKPEINLMWIKIGKNLNIMNKILSK